MRPRRDVLGPEGPRSGNVRRHDLLSGAVTLMARPYEGTLRPVSGLRPDDDADVDPFTEEKPALAPRPR